MIDQKMVKIYYLWIDKAFKRAAKDLDTIAVDAFDDTVQNFISLRFEGDYIKSDTENNIASSILNNAFQFLYVLSLCRVFRWRFISYMIVQNINYVAILFWALPDVELVDLILDLCNQVFTEVAWLYLNDLPDILHTK